MKKIRFFEDLENRHRIKLTNQQYNAIIRTEGYNLLLACPGSGKTTVMVIKTAYLINVMGMNPYQILTLTFTKSAALDMEKRYNHLFYNQDTLPQFATIHSFCYKIMNYTSSLSAIKKENIEGRNTRNLSKTKVISNIYESIFNKKPLDNHLEEIINAISYIKNLMLDLEELDYKAFNIRYLKEIYLAYERYKEKNHFFDYDDMLFIAYEILLKDSKLLNKLRKQFLYIQVDEAQDNSKIQNEIIRLLVHKDNNLFMVADDDQTIYEWRGAYPEGILNFKNQYEDATIFPMEENFRSSKDIVDISNKFIQHNKKRFHKNLITNNPSLKPIEILYQNSVGNPYEFPIKQIISNKKSLIKYAFLYRNNISSILIAYELSKAKIDFYLKGNHLQFFGHWIVRDIKDFLLYARTGELRYFERIYYKNNIYMSKKDFNLAKKNISNGKNIIDHIYYNSELKEYQKGKLIELKWKFKRLSRISINKAIPFIKNELGYDLWLRTAEETLKVSTDGAKKILDILDIIAKDSRDFLGFIEEIEKLEKTLDSSEKSGRESFVTLSTIHGAKGLEFDCVYMVDLDQGILPCSDALNELEQLEAERRLFYVGMTRAKQNLYLISSTNLKEKVSIFVQEVNKIINQKDL